MHGVGLRIINKSFGSNEYCMKLYERVISYLIKLSLFIRFLEAKRQNDDPWPIGLMWRSWRGAGAPMSSSTWVSAWSASVSSSPLSGSATRGSRPSSSSSSDPALWVAGCSLPCWGFCSARFLLASQGSLVFCCPCVSMGLFFVLQDVVAGRRMTRRSYWTWLRPTWTSPSIKQWTTGSGQSSTQSQGTEGCPSSHQNLQMSGENCLY